MNTRNAKKQDEARLKELWNRCFGDDEAYVELYFSQRDWIKETLVLEKNDVIVSMLAIIPVDMMCQNIAYKGAMIYAVATHPDFEKKGYGSYLIQSANELLNKKGVHITMLVPANEGLFQYYEKLGYERQFVLFEREWSREELFQLQEIDLYDCALTVAEPWEYNQIRNQILSGCSYVSYREDEIVFQKKESQFYGADLMKIMCKDTVGCAVIERISARKVLIKELLIEEDCLAVAMILIGKQMASELYIFRTPEFFSGELVEELKSFGMIRINDSYLRSEDPICQKNAYLGIAYD